MCPLQGDFSERVDSYYCRIYIYIHTYWIINGDTDLSKATGPAVEMGTENYRRWPFRWKHCFDLAMRESDHKSHVFCPLRFKEVLCQECETYSSISIPVECKRASFFQTRIWYTVWCKRVSGWRFPSVNTPNTPKAFSNSHWIKGRFPNQLW